MDEIAVELVVHARPFNTETFEQDGEDDAGRAVNGIHGDLDACGAYGLHIDCGKDLPDMRPHRVFLHGLFGTGGSASGGEKRRFPVLDKRTIHLVAFLPCKQPAAGAYHFVAVVGKRVMACRDHDARARVEMGRCDACGRRRRNPDVHGGAAPGGDAFEYPGCERGSGRTRIPSDNNVAAAAQPGLDPGQGTHEIGRERFADNAANARDGHHGKVAHTRFPSVAS